MKHMGLRSPGDEPAGGLTLFTVWEKGIIIMQTLNEAYNAGLYTGAIIGAIAGLIVGFTLGDGWKILNELIFKQ